MALRTSAGIISGGTSEDRAAGKSEDEQMIASVLVAKRTLQMGQQTNSRENLLYRPGVDI